MSEKFLVRKIQLARQVYLFAYRNILQTRVHTETERRVHMEHSQLGFFTTTITAITALLQIIVLIYRTRRINLQNVMQNFCKIGKISFFQQKNIINLI